MKHSKSFFSSHLFNILICIIFPPYIYSILYYSKKMDYFMRSLIALILIPVSTLYGHFFDMFFNIANTVLHVKKFSFFFSVGAVVFTSLTTLYFFTKGIKEIFKKRRSIALNRELMLLDIENSSIVNKLINEPQQTKTAPNDFSLVDVINKFTNQHSSGLQVIKTFFYENGIVCLIEKTYLANQDENGIPFIQYDDSFFMTRHSPIPDFVICLFTQDKLNLHLNSLIVPKRRSGKNLLKRINKQILDEVIKLTKESIYDSEFDFLNDDD